MTRALALLALLMACHCGGSPPPDNAGSGPLVLTALPSAPADLVESYAARWAAATGLDVTTGPVGLPVSFEPSAMMVGNTPVCGGTARTLYQPGSLFVSLDSIKISTAPVQDCKPERELLHEIGHAVCAWGVDSTAECHSAEGTLMALKTNGVACIDAESLATVCSERACLAFIPEC